MSTMIPAASGGVLYPGGAVSGPTSSSNPGGDGAGLTPVVRPVDLRDLGAALSRSGASGQGRGRGDPVYGDAVGRDRADLSPEALRAPEPGEIEEYDLIFVRRSELDRTSGQSAEAREAREMRLARIKAQIADGSYDADLHLDVVADRVMRDLGAMA